MSKRFVVKKAGLWPVHAFCNILDRISSFIHVNEKFCNKRLIFGLARCSVNRVLKFYCL